MKKLIFVMFLVVLFGSACFAIDYIGDFTKGSTVTSYWVANGVEGNSVAPDTNGTITVRRSDNVVITMGITNSAIATGFYKCVVDTNTDSNYATAYDYVIWTSDANINGMIVNAPFAQFSIQNRYVPAVPTAAQIAAEIINEANVAFGPGPYTASTLPTNFSSLSITAGGLVDITQTAADKIWGTTSRTITGGTITTYTGNTLQTGDSYAIVNNSTYGLLAIYAKGISADSNVTDLHRWLDPNNTDPDSVPGKINFIRNSWTITTEH